MAVETCLGDGGLPGQAIRAGVSCLVRWLVVCVLLSCPMLSAAIAGEVSSDGDVTFVEGPSLITRLRLSRQQSALGNIATIGVRPASATSSVWGTSSFPESLRRPFTLTGADLYRLNCQSCHNVEGIGLPPEIRSLIDPIRAMSPLVIREQMAKRGLSLDPATIKLMASQAEASLRERLQKGGEKMPAFPHLNSAEVEALIAYLQSLAGVPGATAKQQRVTEPVVRVGEHLVKGTCFICHDAIGPGRDAMLQSPELVPSLASFLEQEPVGVVVHKVLEGAPAPVPSMLGKRGDMPVLSYLTREEVTAAYIYLTLYPPRGK
jgi:mono/diheme cytochrome c family protein